MSSSSRFLNHRQADLESADVVLALLPFDDTVSYLSGTAQGPDAIVAASDQLEEFEEEFQWEPTNEINLHSLPVYNCGKGESVTAYIDRVTEELKSIPKEKFVIGLGGEHSVTVPLVRRCMNPGDLVISIDAHPDLRDSYLGEHYSHASVMKRLFDEQFRICELGLRCISKEEYEFVKSQPRIVQHWMHELTTPTGFDDMLKSLHDLEGSAYLSIDADGLDTSIMPGVGTPIPGGFTWCQLMRILKELFSNEKLTIRGCDLVEVRPLPDNPISEFTAAKIIQKILSYRERMPKSGK